MTRVFLALIALLALSGSARAQPTTWEKSFIPPQVDGSGNFMGGTEVRSLVVFRGALYAGNNYWEDHPGPERQTERTNPAAGFAHGSWQQEVNFGQFCTPDRPKCALGTGALDLVHFLSDKNGAPVDLRILVASTWDTRDPSLITVYAKNNSDGVWHETILATVDDPEGQVRSFGSHVDAETAESWAFAGSSPTGIYPGLLSDKRGAGKNPIEWQSEVEYKASDYTGPPCDHPGHLANANRVTSFAEAGGKIYAAICFQVLERLDGPRGRCASDRVLKGEDCVLRWKVIWTDRDVTGSDLGVRGLTAITHSDKPMLLAAEEGNVMRVAASIRLQEQARSNSTPRSR